MEEDDFRGWDELIPDALGLIFIKLSLQEILTIIPCVCKPWRKVVMGPYCWQEIDVEEWSNQQAIHDPHIVDRVLRTLVARSCGSLRKLCASGVYSDQLFLFISEHARTLRNLRLPRSEISDHIVEQVADRLCMLNFLDLSYCGEIGARALEAIGKNCKFLTGLRRNMHPLAVDGEISQNEEAYAVAATMPKLKHLEMAYLHVDTASLMAVIRGCPDLELLDLRGCWDVKLDEEYVKENFSKLKVLGPIVVDQYERNDWEEDCSDFSDDFSFYDDDDDDYGILDEGILDEEERLGGIELRFYQGFHENSCYGWPPSP